MQTIGSTGVPYPRCSMMRMVSVFAAVVPLLLLQGCGTRHGRQSSTGSAADLIVIGDVYTMDASAPKAAAIAVAGGRLVFVGDARRARALLRPGGRTIELAPGQSVLPGLVDSHVHMLEAGVLQLGCPIEVPKSKAVLAAAIEACAAAHPEAAWLIGTGWPTALFDELGPRKEELDALVPDRPAVIWGEDGHSAWLNSAALLAAAIGPDTEDPPLGRIERRPGSTEPSGTLRETAMDLVEAHVPPTTAEQYAAGLAIGQRHLHGFGITLVQDPNVNPRQLAAYHAAATSGVLTMKVVAAQLTDPRRPASQVDELIALRERFSAGHLTASSAKIFLDGVLEGRTAALLAPYEGSSNDRGTANWSASALTEIARRLDAAGFQIHMHGIGDRAIREGLDALAAVRAANGPSDLRHHIAHLELVDPADIPRLAALGVFANFQPYWMFADASIAQNIEPLIGAARTARLYEIRAFEQAGTRIVAGSDWPVSTANPFLAIEVGMTRRDPTDAGASVWNPAQRVSLDTLLRAYTIEGATLNHRERDTGSLEVGKAADFIILDRDLFAIPPEDIGETRVLATFVDGVQVHAAAD
jgi:predicted amidohydrolase YtcJ